MPHTTADNILNAIHQDIRARMAHPNNRQRYGQAVFNIVYRWLPEIANGYRGGVLDPFYDDELANPFLKAVAQNVYALQDKE